MQIILRFEFTSQGAEPRRGASFVPTHHSAVSDAICGQDRHQPLFVAYPSPIASSCSTLQPSACACHGSRSTPTVGSANGTVSGEMVGPTQQKQRSLKGPYPSSLSCGQKYL